MLYPYYPVLVLQPDRLPEETAVFARGCLPAGETLPTVSKLQGAGFPSMVVIEMGTGVNALPQQSHCTSGASKSLCLEVRGVRAPCLQQHGLHGQLCNSWYEHRRNLRSHQQNCQLQNIVFKAHP
eukprot:1157735-Pelagomonas_calceolata.AAC.1